jgi:zinc protease
MSTYVSIGDWRLMFLMRDRLRAVTPEDVQRVAKAYLKPTNRTLGEFLPEAAGTTPDRAVIPAKSDVAAVLKDYKGDPAVAQGEAFEPSPGNIESRTKRLTLAGGMKVTLLSRRTRGNTVSATIRLHFGTLERLKNIEMTSGMSLGLLMRGTKNKTRQQIQDEFDKLQARGQAGGSGMSAFAQASTTRANLAPTLRLLAELLREPSFPEADFEQLRKTRLTGIDASRTEPQSLASIAYQSIMYPFPRGDLRHMMTHDEEYEDVKNVTLEAVKKFHRDFVGASNAELSVVGDFDPAEIEKVAAELFGDWRSPGAYERALTPYEKVAPVTRVIVTPDKQNANFLAGQKLNLDDADPDYPALVLANYMLGGGFLNSRLAVRIRQKDGLSYGVSSSLSASAENKLGMFSIQAIAAPQNIDKVEAAAKEEVARAMKDGFTAEEVAAAKSGWLQSRKVGRNDDGSIAGVLATRAYDNRTMAWDEDFEAKVGALTPDQIKAALGKHFDLAQWVIVKAGDFKAPAAAK